ncbi:unnamed protein product [Fructobacillus tropaeoli]|nr:unnamed protein product [Fructobacillus tropaeoli]
MRKNLMYTNGNLISNRGRNQQEYRTLFAKGAVAEADGVRAILLGQ